MSDIQNRLIRALPIIAVLCLLLGGFALWLGPQWRTLGWKGELRDPDVEALFLECGNENDPPGTGMPAWPSGDKRFYTRQSWAGSGELVVEVWEFREPGHVLVSAKRHVEGSKIVVEPRWEIPPGSAVAACYAKLGTRVKFKGLPRMNYVVEAN